MMKWIAPLVVAASAQWAHADELKSMQISATLGALVGSEKICGLAIDQGRLADYVARNIDAGDMEFAGRMARDARIMPGDYQDMPKSMQTVHCVQMRRLAKTLGVAAD